MILGTFSGWERPRKEKKRNLHVENMTNPVNHLKLVGYSLVRELREREKYAPVKSWILPEMITIEDCYDGNWDIVLYIVLLSDGSLGPNCHHNMTTI